NVKYVLADGYFPPGSTEVVLRHDGEVKVYEVEGALPRAFVAHATRQVRDDTVALAILRTNAIDPRREVLWSEPAAPPALSDPSVPDSVQTIRYDFNEIEYLVSTAAAGLLVAVDQYDPDWVATVNGQPAVIHRVNYLMRGVVLPPGVHRVRFTYAPRALAAGVRISLASAILSL